LINVKFAELEKSDRSFTVFHFNDVPQIKRGTESQRKSLFVNDFLSASRKAELFLSVISAPTFKEKKDVQGKPFMLACGGGQACR
jgi:hypothetical protein